MRNLIPHPTSSPSQNLSKNTGRYVKNTNKKSSFFHSSSKINNYYFIIFLRRPILDQKFPLMFSNQKFRSWSLNFDFEEERNPMLSSLKNSTSVESPNFPQ